MMYINLEKENPLITILKNGKIPVVRISNEGFKNYNQTPYKETHNEAKEAKYFPSEGCFVHIGGIQGTYVSGNHFGEMINIGYIEPEEKIFKTYSCSKNRKKEFCYEKARKRFNDIKFGYYEYIQYINTDKKKEIFLDSYPLEDFDLLTEAIVDASKITPIITIPQNDTRILRYCNQDYLRLFCVDVIFNHNITNLKEDFLNHFGVTKVTDTELNLMNDNKLYASLWLEEFYYYINNNSFKYTTDYITSFKDRLNNFHMYINKIKEEYKLTYQDLIIREHANYLFIGLNNYSKRVDFCFINNQINIEKKVKNPAYFDELLKCSLLKDYSGNKEPKFISSEVLEDDLYDKDFRNLLYIITDIYDKYKELFSKYYIINESPLLEYVKRIRTLEQAIKNYSYELKSEDGGKLFVKTDAFSLEYSFILKDGVLIVKNSEKIFYNLDNIEVFNNNLKVKQAIETLVKVIEKNNPQARGLFFNIL